VVRRCLGLLKVLSGRGENNQVITSDSRVVVLDIIEPSALQMQDRVVIA
jgi:hypothetical protein